MSVTESVARRGMESDDNDTDGVDAHLGRRASDPCHRERSPARDTTSRAPHFYAALAAPAVAKIIDWPVVLALTTGHLLLGLTTAQR